MNIEEVMSRPVYTCIPKDSLAAAAQLMLEHGLGALPVVSATGELIGMVTDRDICMTAYTRRSTLQTIPVSTAMTKKAFSCRATDSIGDAERLMRDKLIRRLPVVDADNRPIGLLSLDDLARHAAAVEQSGVEHEFVQTMAAICEPRLAA